MTLSSSVPLMLSEVKGDCRSPGTDSWFSETEKRHIRERRKDRFHSHICAAISHSVCVTGLCYAKLTGTGMRVVSEIEHE